MYEEGISLMHNYYYYVILSQLHTCPAAPVTNTRFTFSLPAIFPLHTPFSFFYTTLLLLVLLVLLVLLLLLLLSTLFFPFPFSLLPFLSLSLSKLANTTDRQRPTLSLSPLPPSLLSLFFPYLSRSIREGPCVVNIGSREREKEIRE